MIKKKKPIKSLTNQSLLNSDLECRSHEYRLSLKWLDSCDKDQALNLFNIWKSKPIKLSFTNNGRVCLDNEINMEDEYINARCLSRGYNLSYFIRLSLKSYGYKQSLK